MIDLKRRTAFWAALLVSVCLAAGQQTATELESLKFGAYEHYERGRIEEAIEAFRLYLERRPADLRVKFDLAMLLSELSRDEQAAALLEEIRREEPRHEVAAFRLGVTYVKLKRHEQAGEIFEALGESANPDLARAASEALGRMNEDVSRESRLLAETRVFELAGQGRHDEVVTAVGVLESRGELSWLMEMQRLHALDQMGELTLALDHANRLALRQPSAVDLTLFRADLLSRLGRVPEALALWGKLVREEPGSRAAAEAARRIRVAGTGEESGSEAGVYALAAREEHEAVLAAIGAIEQREEPLTPEMRLQRLYSLQVLGRYEEGLREAEVLVERQPEMSEGAWMRAQFLDQLDRHDAAEAAYQELVERHPDTRAAWMAVEWLAREEMLRLRREVFALAEAGRHEAVIEAVNGLEERNELTSDLALQRIYSWQALRDFETALEALDELIGESAPSPELALLQADLLMQTGADEEAQAKLEEIRRRFPDTIPAAVAAERQESVRLAQKSQAQMEVETRIFELANRREHREVVDAIDELEREAALSLILKRQRLYALQALGETDRALEEADRMAAEHPDAVEVKLVRADMLLGAGRWREAWETLKEVEREEPDSAAGREAEARLRGMPARENLDRWYWGEAYASGDYLGRFGAVVGAGYFRHGTFIPGARWLQPYQEARFTVDTDSGVGGGRSIIADNNVGLSLGLRAQPFASEYLFLYASGGLNLDLLNRRNEGEWAEDYQAGIYGFKVWGPGLALLHQEAASQEMEGAGVLGRLCQWRGEWFADVGGDFSYYHRLSSWIGYGQARQGLRLWQWGPDVAMDAYAVENLSWDVKGNYFDNLIEVGPGVRWLWIPEPSWQVVLRAEWLNGFHWGRNELGNRGDADSHYDEVRVGLSVGVRW